MKKLATLFLTVCLLAFTAVSVSAAYELTPYDLPTNGVHFSFDGTYATDNDELIGTPRGQIDFIKGHDGTANGAIYLDSKDEYIELLKEDYAGNWTTSAWIRTDEAVPYAFLTMSYDYSVRPVTNGNLLGEAGVSHHGNKDYMFTSSALPLGDWAMFTVTHDMEAGIVSSYVDGIKIEEIDASIACPMLLIGNDSAENRNWAVEPYMAIDDLWMFGRVLSEDEVKTLYEKGAVEAVDENYGKMDAEALQAILDAQLEAERNPFGLEKYTIPAEGRHFSFDGKFTDDSGELVGEARGSIVAVEGRDGTANGAAFFDTADDNVFLNKADYWGDWSLSSWIKMDAYAQYNFLVMSATTYSLRPCQSGTEGLIGVGNSKSGDANVETAIPLGAWAMLTYTYSEENKLITIYLNGESVGTIEKEMPLAMTLIGGDAAADQGGKGWQTDPLMAIDDLWIFGKTLTADEVTTLYTTNTIVAATQETSAPETEVAETAAPETEVAETTAPDTEAAETAAPEQEVVETAPQTSDVALIVLCFSAISSLAAVKFGKRKN